EEPEVRSLYSVVGQAPGNGAGFSLSGSNQAEITVLLVSRADRSRSAADIAEDIRTSLEGQYPGAKIQVGMPNAFGFGGFAGAPIQVQIQGTDPQTVDGLSRDVQAAIATVPGAVDLDNSDDNVQPQLRAKIDWTRAADLGVSARDAGAALRAALDGFTSNGNQSRQPDTSATPIRILTGNASQTTPADVRRLPISTSGGGVVELGQFTTLTQASIPTSIDHVNRLRSVTIGVNAGD